MKKLTKILIVGFGSFAFLASSASAVTYTFSINLTPEMGGMGSGRGTATYNDVTRKFSWNYNFTGLTNPVEVTGAHFHLGEAPQVIIANYATSPNVGSRFITPAQGAALKSGSWYLNIHTSYMMGGELSGYLVKTGSNAAKHAERNALKKKIDRLEKKYKKTKSKLSKAKAKRMRASIKKLLARFRSLNASL